MRWIHIDRIIELRQGEYARAIKAVPSCTDFLQDHFPGFPVMPHSLILESMAQTAGLLIGRSIRFERDVILAKIDRADFLSITRPGDLLIIEARIEELRDEGAKAQCSVLCGDREVARASLVFAILGDEDARSLGARGFVFPEGLLSRFTGEGRSAEKA